MGSDHRDRTIAIGTAWQFEIKGCGGMNRQLILEQLAQGGAKVLDNDGRDVTLNFKRTKENKENRLSTQDHQKDMP